MCLHDEDEDEDNDDEIVSTVIVERRLAYSSERLLSENEADVSAMMH